MKRIVFLLLAFVFNLSIAQEICGTPHSVNPELEKMIAKRIMAQRQNDTKSFCINIHFKIVRPSNATGDTPPAYLDAIIEKLNEYYNPHKISFGSIGYEYIDNSKYFTIENDKEAKELGSSKNKSNAINYYIVERLWKTDRGIVTGMAMGIPSNALVIGKSYILDVTSAHEVGHCLGLYHTFQKWSHCNETANNCTTCGDYVCDTPIENSNENYNPNLFNIMTYSDFGNHFTQGQATRMRSFLQEAPVLQSIKDKFCFHKLTGSPNVCADHHTTYTLTGHNGGNVEWVLSSMIVKISSDNNSITVRAANDDYIPNPRLDSIIAKVNGVEVSKKIWASGKPRFEVSSYDYHSATVDSSIEGITLEQQGVTGGHDISWRSLTRHNTVHYGANHHSLISYREPDPLYISVSNSCGTEIGHITLQAPYYCKGDHWIGHISGDYYAAYEPCDNNGEYRPYTTNSILDTDKKSSLTIQISNATGQVVLTTQNKKFSLAHLLPGTYYARIIKNGKIVHTQTLLKR